MQWSKMQSKSKLSLSVTVALVVVLSALMAPIGFASASSGAPVASPQLTLTPNTYLAGGTTQFALTASSATFSSGSPVYYEYETSPVWVPGDATLWMTLSAGQTTIPLGTLTPSPASRATGTYYFLLSASTPGTLGVFASEALTATSIGFVPSAVVVPAVGDVASMANVTGSGYDHGASIVVYWFVPGPTTLGASQVIATGTASATGTIHIPITIPNTVFGTYDVAVLATNTTSGNSVYGYDTGVWFTTFAVNAAISVSPSAINAGGSFTLTGTGFNAATTVTITDSLITFASAVTFTPDSNGAFSGTVSTAGGTFSAPGYGSTILTASQAGLFRSLPTAALTVNQPTITVNPVSIVTGQPFTVTGANFGAGSVIPANSITIAGVNARNSVVTIGASGTFTVTVATASMTTFTTGSNTVSVTATQTGLSQTATTPLTFKTFSIVISPSTISPGQSVTITGSNFFPSATIGANSIVIGGATVTNPVVTVGSDGSFSVVASTLSFTGTLTSDIAAGVTVSVALPVGVTVNTFTTETGTGSVDLLSPTISIVYPAGMYSLSPGQTITVTGSSFFPGATIAANSITYDGVAGTNALITVSAAGTFSAAFTLPATVTASGVYTLTVTEAAPGRLSVSPDFASINAILSSPSLNALTIELSATASSIPVSSLDLQYVGNTVYVYLLGYPADATGISLMIGGTVVATGIATDANGAFLGTVVVPPLAGSDGGVEYLVQSGSNLGLQAQFPADLFVYPTVNVVTGTEPYFTDAALSIGYLAAGDTATVSGTGYDALSPVTFYRNGASVITFAAPVMTDQFGSFSATFTVGTVFTNTYYYLGAYTASADPGSYAAFAGYAAPTVDVYLPAGEIGATGSIPTVAGYGLVSFGVSGITVDYTVSGPIGASAVVTDAANTNSTTVTAGNGVYTETISGAAPFNTLTGTVIFEVTNAGSAGYLVVLNAAGQQSSKQNAAPGSGFSVYAIGFSTEALSTIALGATGPGGSFTGLTTLDQVLTDATDGGAVFIVGVSGTLSAGTYLIFGTQGSPVSYTTSISGSIVVNVGPTIVVSDGVSGGAFDVNGAGFAPYTTYSVYFGDGVNAGANVGAVMSDASGTISVTVLTVPILDGGTYMVGLAPYTAATTIPVSDIMPSTLTPMTVINNVVWSPDPMAFPGQLVSFAYTPVLSLSPSPIPGTLTAAVLLNGVPYATVPASYGGGIVSGSFTMFNGAPGASYTLSLQPVYQALSPAFQNDTQTLSFTSSGTTQILKWSIPKGAGDVLSANGYYGAAGATPAATPTATIVQPTAVSAGSVTVTLTGLTAATGYIVTLTIETESMSSVGQTVVGAVSNPATLTLVNGSGALVLSINHADIVQIATLSGANVNITLANLGAKISGIYALGNKTYASLTSGFGNMTVSLNDINAIVTANAAGIANIENGIVTLSTTLGTVTAALSAIGATVTTVSNNVIVLSTTVGQINTNLTALNAKVVSIEAGIATLTTDVGQIQVSLTAIGAQLTSVAGDVATLTSTVGTMSASLTAIGTKVTSISNGVATIQTELGTLTGNVTSISNGIATIQTSLGTLQTSVNAIPTNPATASNLNTAMLLLYVVIVLVIITLALAAVLLSRVGQRRPPAEPPKVYEAPKTP